VAPSIVAPDYYAVLQVHPDADREVIEAAYRQLMRKYHPDIAGGDTVRAAALHKRATAHQPGARRVARPWAAADLR
jgi:DnaJ-class molecular chaperone